MGGRREQPWLLVILVVPILAVRDSAAHSLDWSTCLRTLCPAAVITGPLGGKQRCARGWLSCHFRCWVTQSANIRHLKLFRHGWRNPEAKWCVLLEASRCSQDVAARICKTPKNIKIFYRKCTKIKKMANQGGSCLPCARSVSLYVVLFGPAIGLSQSGPPTQRARQPSARLYCSRPQPPADGAQFWLRADLG